jgi:hypothetical protein
MNANGKTEIILFGYNEKEDVSVLYQNNQGLYDTADLIKTNSNTNDHFFLLQDFESDGDIDIFIHSDRSQEINIIRNKLH